jgi:hypothetical protein
MGLLPARRTPVGRKSAKILSLERRHIRTRVRLYTGRSPLIHLCTVAKAGRPPTRIAEPNGPSASNTPRFGPCAGRSGPQAPAEGHDTGDGVSEAHRAAQPPFAAPRVARARVHARARREAGPPRGRMFHVEHAA